MSFENPIYQFDLKNDLMIFTSINGDLKYPSIILN
jgi:hypothetical protein